VTADPTRTAIPEPADPPNRLATLPLLPYRAVLRLERRISQEGMVSVGGNDALGESRILGARARSVGEAVAMLAQAQSRFAAHYADMVESVLALELPTALCTIYDTPASAPNHLVIRTALSLFNDIITRAAFGQALPLVDLRLICREEEDYANPIEPSARGGDKIASAIARLIASEEAEPRSVVAAR